MVSVSFTKSDIEHLTIIRKHLDFKNIRFITNEHYRFEKSCKIFNNLNEDIKSKEYTKTKLLIENVNNLSKMVKIEYADIDKITRLSFDNLPKTMKKNLYKDCEKFQKIIKDLIENKNKEVF